MQEPILSVAIACGGTGGHLFPGLAVAERLQQRSCHVTLLVSQKAVDQQGVQSAHGMEVQTLPAVALQRGAVRPFLRGFWRSYRLCSEQFRHQRPDAVLAMGGFTSAPAILAGRKRGAATFLHEANSIPGRANRWLSYFADEVFVGFPEAAPRLPTPAVQVTGTPVRSEFQPADPAACRIALGLNPNRPVLLIMGGSQGAHAINELAVGALPTLRLRAPQLQFIHLAGNVDAEKVAAAYRLHQGPAMVRAFLTEMELALGAATLAVGRAGASSLAEFAAMRLPAILIPYPSAADNHQFHNARALFETGAAVQLNEPEATPERLAELIVDLIENPSQIEAMRRSLEPWAFSDAAEKIAQYMLDAIGQPEPICA
ncbi:MAG: undecaprenyldiphospho-muramoylpentapeptide beta-N-acetylglucosaminyltransferase [Verrucomicrobia bacterium]|nr:undecaprenyldiphospho-muramoylpentapeptide beta-N-acetylglucosaminyltransferase [Verrucomicrobiota bacterium]